MSSLSLVRLRELKEWQGSFENLLRNRNKEDGSSKKSMSDDSEVTHDSSFHSTEKAETKTLEWDSRKISPMKPFDQLLEEKLAEDTAVVISAKPKKPFLRKGQGLARFRMTNDTYPVKSQTKRKQGLSKKTPLQRDHPSKPTEKIWKNNNSFTNRHKQVDLSPLSIPDFIKPRGTWKQVFESARTSSVSEASSEGDQYEEFRESLLLGEHREEVESGNGDGFRNGPKVYITSKIQNMLVSNEIPNRIASLDLLEIPKSVEDLTSDEHKSERELRAFEMLEERVDRNSFCSTNTSIINLLASTPQKQPKKKILEQVKEIESDTPIEEVFPSHMRNAIHIQLTEVADKADILEQFLLNLKAMDQRNKTKSSVMVETSVSTNTSFSDENTRWSSASPSLTNVDGAEMENAKISVGINTSFDNISRLDDTLKTHEPCNECEELRKKCSSFQIQINHMKTENANLKSDLNVLQIDCDNLRLNVKKNGEIHKEKLQNIERELSSERKKIAKERLEFKNYIKEAENRPSKKEREEITQLKQELADAKELLKLKEKKYGETQARLRSQVKQQEKEILHLKSTVETLQKENAKLTASQKYARRPQDVKILHEINKNISKLAEETLKRQLNKSAQNNTEEKMSNPEQKSPAIKEHKNIVTEAKENQNKPKRLSNSAILLSNEIPGVGLSIEKQYESMFGHLSSPESVDASTTVEKNERTLPDGSIEIKYSNGNVKVISPDGKQIKINYFNGDIKETNLVDQTIRYFYTNIHSWHTQYPDGTEVIEYKEGQKCTKYPNGKTEIHYSDGSMRIMEADGTEEHRYPDGRRAMKNLKGEQIITLPNGQREIHTPEYKRREYPDGTVRTLHKDGTVETVYANGRIRIKDANGVLLMDTHDTPN